MRNFDSQSKGLRRVHFYRDFKGVQGGHFKVFDYFNHVRSSSFFDVTIRFSSDSHRDQFNPWQPDFYGESPMPSLNLECGDLIFLAGMDWEYYFTQACSGAYPVINLIQGVRHADQGTPLYQFLKEPAVRICVSPEVSEAVQNTGVVNGPIFTIPNGLQLPSLLPEERIYDVFIMAIKDPLLGERIKRSLCELGLRVFVLDVHVSRDALYRKMSQSRIALLLPLKKEGFYLPALEALNFAQLTIVPDCIGNRSFCRNGENCLMPEYNFDSLYTAVVDGICILNDEVQIQQIQRGARLTVEKHGLLRERSEFLKILENIDSLWAKVCKN